MNRNIWFRNRPFLFFFKKTERRASIVSIDVYPSILCVCPRPTSGVILFSFPCRCVFRSGTLGRTSGIYFVFTFLHTQTDWTIILGLCFRSAYSHNPSTHDYYTIVHNNIKSASPNSRSHRHNKAHGLRSIVTNYLP